MPFSPSDHTFVVCAYKENPFLEETVTSLLAQDRLSPVLISTSTPNSHIESVAKKCGVPMVVNPNPRGAGGDWNFGYDAAETSLVTIAHQDDFYKEGFLSTMLEAINRYNAADVEFAFADYFEIRDGVAVAKNSLLNIKRLLNAPLSSSVFNRSSFVKRRVLSFGNPICCPAVMLVKQNLGPSIFDEQYKNSCDYKTWVDLAETPGRFVYVPERLMGHRIYEESSTSLNLKDGIRQAEDLEILSSLWPSQVAKLIYRVYSLSEKSNELS
nr:MULTISPECIES: glycosyltransferase [unclassified Adlercreutzia]